MATFLFKTEPGDYSYDDLVREKRAVWSGVRNPVALRNLRTVKKGDEILIYHTGDEKSIVGLAKAVGVPYEDPKSPGLNDAGEPKMAVVDIAPVAKAKNPVALAAVKADTRFATFPLVTQGRLSVMPVPPELNTALRTMAGF
jgi:predicted RNA-binding protein with PUA-like domain